MLLCESPPSGNVKADGEFDGIKQKAQASLREGKYGNSVVKRVAAIKPRGRRAISTSKREAGALQTVVAKTMSFKRGVYERSDSQMKRATSQE